MAADNVRNDVTAGFNQFMIAMDCCAVTKLIIYDCGRHFSNGL